MIKSLVQNYVPPAESRKGSQTPPSKRILVLCNPYGGEKRGVKILREVVEPMLDKTNVPYDVICTTHGSHAFEIGQSLPKRNQYNLIVSISGDGMLQNILQGFASSCKSNPDEMKRICENLAIAVVPAGTGNGLSLSLGFNNSFEAVKGIIELTPKYIDVMEISSMDPKNPRDHYWDLHTFNWTFTADVDYIMEHGVRWMSKSLRELYAPIVVVLRRKGYWAKRIAIRPAHMSDHDLKTKFYEDPRTLKDADKPGWKLIEGKISTFMAANTPIQGIDVPLTPHSKLDEDACDLAVVLHEDVGRLNCIWMFLTQVPQSKHIETEMFKVYKVHEIELIPESGILDHSGEECDFGDYDAGVRLLVRAKIVRIISKN